MSQPLHTAPLRRLPLHAQPVQGSISRQFISSPIRATTLAFAALLSLTCIPSTQAQTEPTAQQQQHRFQIAPGSLVAALASFAAQAGANVSAPPELVSGKNTAGLQGSFSAAEALQRLLAGTGLEVASGQNGNFVLRATVATGNAASAGSLPEVVVTAPSLPPGRTEGADSYAATGPSSTATRLNLSQRETPQSVSVITREHMDDRGFQSLDEVALDATGITTRQLGGGERTQFFARGFAINTFLADGVPLDFDYDTEGVATLAMYDRVEVLRGASGLMTGTGNPSGTISLVRKRPTATPQASITGSYGSWANRRGELDVAGPLNAAATLRGRTVVALQDSNTFKRAYEHQRRLVYGTVEADLNANTVLSIGGYYNREDNPGADWNGLPTARDGSFLPFDRSTRLTPDWAYWNKENTSVFAELEHNLDNGWTAQTTARALRSKMDMKGTYLYPLEDSDTLFGQGAGAYIYEKTQYSLDAMAKGPWTVGGRTHDVVVGASLRRSSNDDGPGGWPSDYAPTIDPLSWDPGSQAMPSFNYQWGRTAMQRQYGIYGTVRLHVADPLHVLVGARLDSYQYQQEIVSGPTFRGHSAYRVSSEFTPYLGLVYTLNDQHSVYASWASIFQPQNYESANGSLLDPVQGTNLELGLKGEYFGGRLTGSAAVFQVNQDNLPMALALANCAPGATECYAPAGEVRARGAEFELAGEPVPGWSIATGYTYYTARHIKASSEAAAGTPFDTQTPRHLFKLATRWRLPGAWNDWSIGASLRTRSNTRLAQYNVYQGGYTIMDVMAAWQVSRNLDIRLNLNNIFDKTYYQNIGSTQDNNHFGAPRNALITARYQF
ncbi:TonB-dependent siderophore receptor [Lampropedia puyangensis]|uniref:TonB-dependent siderophore receptor n=1 Tax=Lampropedia puyangensis TaxID=1330072 RepID=A0A4S8FBP2_9BURK|nr:TonB-dependent siderophore receptor [Lampropedia puyangensis]THU05088.1 TonB-dependent siderophore receptor [Lampropedia puyangensis]